LCIVQDLINTAAIPAFGVPDMLANLSVAQRWLTPALREWSEHTGQPRAELTLSQRDMAALRRVRDDLRHWLLTGDMATLEIPAQALTVGVRAGHTVYGPRGAGVAGLSALVAMELLLASRSGVAHRLRTCMNADCSAAFYDHSRNGSRVWHDVTTCGNVMNLRASRARRKVSTTQEVPAE
jgi:predicted RNA-binding Zn ribbon-like protein